MTEREDGIPSADMSGATEESSAEEATSSLEESRLPGRRVLHVALLLILVVPALLWAIRPSSSGDPAIGGVAVIDEAAPDFSLDLFDGGTFTLRDHLARDGRLVVMNFWASWCTPCRVEMPALDATAHRHPEILFLGVAVQDTEASARAFAEEVAVSYPLGFDGNGAIVGLYPTLGLPTTWVITSDGIIAARWAGQLDENSLESLIAEHPLVE